ncbi:signal recognition particle-docking protein FtsY [Companilactobacillus zhachilii]|uniref:Signal recognition particle receptor FtsY n=1 Tax=Companilactobacillus zhachilii TaxID=2304606 RepID=A0A386PVJ4_9LACO|nr:signal recognition particle-docking protein FtsY [Companilactobacillus zhachilii]AYE38500.1 signal recognition particle-docking protein FtsY [Companilactobacillus zhachilii]
MGLFDRIKKAFTGKDDSEDKELEKKSQEESTQESDQNAESTTDEQAAKTTSKEETAVDETPQVESEEPKEPETDDEAKESFKETTETVNPEPEKTETAEKAAPEKSEEPVNDEAKTSTEVEPEDTKTESEPDKESEPTDTEVVDSETTGSKETATEKEPSDDEEFETEPETDEPKDDVKEYDEGLKKSRNSFSSRLNRFLANFRSVDEDFFDDLEELLIESDVGYETAMRISDELREEVKLENAKKKSDVSNVIVKKLVDMYGEEGKEEDNSLKFSADKTPTVFLFVGVNGAGKTTTVGKLAHRYKEQGKKVLLAAADTFRAGAIEQLQEWGKRDGVDVQASKAHTDPASVVYDAVQRAVNDDYDILLVDTAGRLQNKEGLMRELEKIKRVITRELPDAPQEVLLVLDGSTGQNALSQAKQFKETTDVSGIVLTKLDGSSQGGVVLAIRNELHIPVKLVGLGEQMDDLRDFDPEKFIYGLFKELIVGSSAK